MKPSFFFQSGLSQLYTINKPNPSPENIDDEQNIYLHLFRKTLSKGERKKKNFKLSISKRSKQIKKEEKSPCCPLLKNFTKSENPLTFP